MRKKVSTDVENVAGVLDLAPDDELVTTVTTTKTVGRRKPKPAESEPEAIATGATFDDDDDDVSNVIDIDDDEAEPPPYSPTSIAARIFGNPDGHEDYSNRFCTAIIRREPDDLTDTFLVPCTRQTYIGKIQGVAISGEEDDLADRIRKMNGGGNYTVQYHFAGQIQPDPFKITIADDPLKVREAQQPVYTPPPTVAASAPAIDPQTAFINSLKQAAELRGLLFGDVESQLRDEIKQLREEREQLPPAAPRSEKLELLELAFNSTKAGVADRVVDALFPTEDDQPKRHWTAELFSVALEHKEEIAAIAGPILASFLGGPPRPAMPPPMFPQPTPTMDPPPSLPTGPLFGRRKSEPETAAESEPEAIATGEVVIDNIEAEPATETEQTTEAAA